MTTEKSSFLGFKTYVPIYIQIVEYVYECILKNEWKEDERILSVRDLGVELKVNPNTISRSYKVLKLREIINLKRGQGFFVSVGASDKIKEQTKGPFIQGELNRILGKARLLDISESDIVDLFHRTE